MNTEIGSTLVNGFALNKALSVIYKDLRDIIETNNISSKYVFADISELTPIFNVIGKYPIKAFKTFSNVAEVNIKSVAIIPAISYDINRAGVVTLVDVTTMTLKGIGLVKSSTLSDVEILWMNYISEAKQIVSEDVGNLITIGSDDKLFLSKDVVQVTENMTNKIDKNINIVKVFETYLDYNPSEIKKINNIQDGSYVIILKDPLHNNKSWLYILSNTNTSSPVISPVGEYTEIMQYPSVIAVKEYVDSRTTEIANNFDNDTIRQNSSNIWGVALDRYTINKNKDGLYGVDLEILKKEILQVPSTPDNVVIFNDKGYIKDDGWGITSDNESIDTGDKKLISKRFLNNQRITDAETTDLIQVVEIDKK